jgi:agmatine deiminase
VASRTRGNPAPSLPERTPASSGYAMPAEWERHAGTWLAWPRDVVTFRKLFEVECLFANMAAVLSLNERVNILVEGEDVESLARASLALAGAHEATGASARTGVRLIRKPTVDSWIRDYGPTYVVRRSGRGSRRAFVRWRFNAWGGTYAKLRKDDGLPDRLGLAIPRFAPGIVMEGGSIDVNGAGTVLTTEQCLLNRNRNPGLQRAEVEAYLRAYLGVRQVLWLGEGIVGDDTDGHVDDISRFVSERTIVTAYEDDPKDENFELLHDNWRRLRAMADPEGRPFEIVKLPMPGRVMTGRRRLPASYANFYIANKVVLLPIYGPKARDDAAIAVLRRAFPGRVIVPLDCRAIVYGYGSIHCVTQQEPA